MENLKPKMLAVIDLDKPYIFMCDNEEAVQNFEAALSLLGHESKTFRS